MTAAVSLLPTAGDDSGSGRRAARESKDFEVYGDSAYADGATLDEQAARGHDMRTKVPPVRNAERLFQRPVHH